VSTVEERPPSPESLQRRVDELGWYHSIDVAPGVATRGWWDLRHALPLLPFPDLRGKRCLDIGTWDGFYAYEMERRGAAEVVAIDLPDLTNLDYPPEVAFDESFDPGRTDVQQRSAGFRLLHDLLDSKVEWRGCNVYDVADAELGRFDFVVLGSLLVHLRDPVRALDAVRQVTAGQFLCADFVHARAQLGSLGRPMFELRGEGNDFQWWMASDRGLRQLLHVGGFEVEQLSPFFVLRPGEYGRGLLAQHGTGGVRELARRAVNRVLAGDATPGGHLHRGYLTRPRLR
jgi:tRNA (mo5U34)-methyltransferase